MLAIERWVVYYVDGSTFTSDDGTFAQAPPFGVCCIVYHDVDGGTIFDEQGFDVSLYRWPGPHPTGVVSFQGSAEGCPDPVLMGCWTDGESYWRVHDRARREVSPTP